jgi:F-type H+/Na+-transporting ATPase subunit alpha
MYLGKGFNSYLEESNEVGFVETLKFPLVGVSGLPNVFLGEVVVFEDGSLGMVFSMDEKICQVLALSDFDFDIGSRVTRTSHNLRVSVGEGFSGRAFSCLGRDIFGDFRPSKEVEQMPVFSEPLDFSDRSRISEPLVTGVSIVDLMVPLGKGQRELVLGDRKSGKTEFLLQAMLAQAGEGSVCIYAAVGKNRAEILDVLDFGKQSGIEDRLVVIASSASDSPGEIYVTPYTAMAVAEYYRDKGRDVFLVIDDLSTHAKFYRELSLVSGSFPGRSSYPGDIFFIHSQLLERAGNFKVGDSSKAITCLAVAETTQGDISGYIQTNLMSMTDGHVFFDEELFDSGIRPAVNTFLSVTRVGKQVQSDLHRSLHRELSGFFNLLRKHRRFVHFGAELSEGIKSTLETGEKLEKYFSQQPRVIYPLPIQYVLFTMIWGGFISMRQINSLRFIGKRMSELYTSDSDFRSYIDGLIQQDQPFNTLLSKISEEKDNIIKALGMK